MTQAHKTPGALVVLKPELEMNQVPYMRPFLDHTFRVIREDPPGHLHVVSVSDPTVQLPGFHDERFRTAKGQGLRRGRDD